MTKGTLNPMDADKADTRASWNELPPAEQCLFLSRQIAEIVFTVDEILLLFKQKRTTLEEKMIAKYFHELVERFAKLTGHIHRQLILLDDHKLPGQEARTALFELNTSVKCTVDELLKITRYNFNFLEQYFEHDYFESLVQKHQFMEALDSLSKQFV